jgi:hypothetical protein
VRAQLSHFADLIGSRIAANGPKLRLTAASAQAIGLILDLHSFPFIPNEQLLIGRQRLDAFGEVLDEIFGVSGRSGG